MKIPIRKNMESHKSVGPGARKVGKLVYFLPNFDSIFGEREKG